MGLAAIGKFDFFRNPSVAPGIALAFFLRVPSPLLLTKGPVGAPVPVRVQEIVQRCVFQLVNEASTILAEKIAVRASDVDVCWLYGFGFPVRRGGPLFYADTVGLPSVLGSIRKFGALPGQAEFWTPSPLLEDLVAKGKPFASVV